MLPDRIPRFEFVSMVTPTFCSFIFRPPPLSHVANIYYLPFKGTVWASAGLLVIIAGFVIYLAVSRHRGEDTSRISDIALLGVGAICQMGVHVETKFLSTKISTVCINNIQLQTHHPYLQLLAFSDIFLHLPTVHVYIIHG